MSQKPQRGERGGELYTLDNKEEMLYVLHKYDLSCYISEKHSSNNAEGVAWHEKKLFKSQVIL